MVRGLRSMDGRRLHQPSLPRPAPRAPRLLRGHGLPRCRLLLPRPAPLMHPLFKSISTSIYSCQEGTPMSVTRTAKLFKNGASQAVRLPAEFRFEGNEVYIYRDEKTQDVILSKHPGSKAWREFFDFMRTVDIPEDFMKDRPMNRI